MTPVRPREDREFGGTQGQGLARYGSPVRPREDRELGGTQGQDLVKRETFKSRWFRKLLGLLAKCLQVKWVVWRLTNRWEESETHQTDHRSVAES